MPMQLDKFSISGLKELEQQLLRLGAVGGTKVLRKAGREAMKDVEFAMKMGVNVDSGAERDSIKITTKKQDKKGGVENAVAVRVGPAKKHAQKAIAQEYGNSKTAADPFMRPSLYENRHRVAGTFRTVLAVEIKKALKKL